MDNVFGSMRDLSPSGSQIGLDLALPLLIRKLSAYNQRIMVKRWGYPDLGTDDVGLYRHRVLQAINTGCVTVPDDLRELFSVDLNDSNERFGVGGAKALRIMLDNMKGLYKRWEEAALASLGGEAAIAALSPLRPTAPSPSPTAPLLALPAPEPALAPPLQMLQPAAPLPLLPLAQLPPTQLPPPQLPPPLPLLAAASPPAALPPMSSPMAPLLLLPPPASQPPAPGLPAAEQLSPPLLTASALSTAFQVHASGSSAGLPATPGVPHALAVFASAAGGMERLRSVTLPTLEKSLAAAVEKEGSLDAATQNLIAFDVSFFAKQSVMSAGMGLKKRAPPPNAVFAAAEAQPQARRLLFARRLSAKIFPETSDASQGKLATAYSEPLSMSVRRGAALPPAALPAPPGPKRQRYAYGSAMGTMMDLALADQGGAASSPTPVGVAGGGGVQAPAAASASGAAAALSARPAVFAQAPTTGNPIKTKQSNKHGGNSLCSWNLYQQSVPVGAPFGKCLCNNKEINQGVFAKIKGANPALLPLAPASAIVS